MVSAGATSMPQELGPPSRLLQGLGPLCRFLMLRAPLRSASSGYRCEQHPNEIIKQVPGPHHEGKAVNVVAHGEVAYSLVQLALSHGFGVGMKQHDDISQRYVHMDACDAAPGRPRPWIWTYA